MFYGLLSPMQGLSGAFRGEDFVEFALHEELGPPGAPDGARVEDAAVAGELMAFELPAGGGLGEDSPEDFAIEDGKFDVGIALGDGAAALARGRGQGGEGAPHGGFAPPGTPDSVGVEDAAMAGELVALELPAGGQPPQGVPEHAAIDDGKRNVGESLKTARMRIPAIR